MVNIGNKDSLYLFWMLENRINCWICLISADLESNFKYVIAVSISQNASYGFRMSWSVKLFFFLNTLNNFFLHKLLTDCYVINIKKMSQAKNLNDELFFSHLNIFKKR